MDRQEWLSPSTSTDASSTTPTDASSIRSEGTPTASNEDSEMLCDLPVERDAQAPGSRVTKQDDGTVVVQFHGYLYLAEVGGILGAGERL
ncbi:MAG: hypothetical protein V5A13_11130 [Haloarculaceae archaeon]